MQGRNKSEWGEWGGCPGHHSPWGSKMNILNDTLLFYALNKF